MKEVNDLNLFSVVYDIERPWNKEWSERVKNQHKLSEKERRELMRRREWDRTIGRFVDSLSKIGWRINWSVFLIPERHYETAKRIVETYRSKFADLGVRNDIYILRYHPDSNDILLSKLRMHMKMKIDKLVKKFKESEDTSEKKSIRDQIDMILEIAKSFGIDRDIIQYVSKVVKSQGISGMISMQKSLEDILLSR